MRVVLPERAGVEVPDRGVVHDVEPVRPKEDVVYSGVGLLHEACDFALFVDAAAQADGADHLLHDEFPGEAEKGGVEEHEEHVLGALCVVLVGGVGGDGVGEEEARAEGVGLGGVDGVAGEDEEHYDERVD